MKVPSYSSAEMDHESTRLQRAAWLGLLLLLGVGAGLYFWLAISARRQASEVDRMLRNGRISDAEVAVAKYLRSSPNSAEAYYLSARLAFAKKQSGDVLPWLAKAGEKGYAQAPMERLLGLVYAASGRSDEAEPRLLSAWESESQPDPEVADALCRIYFESYRFVPALRVVNAWTKRAPEDLRALLWLAEIHSRNDSGPDAQIQDFDLILRRDPSQHASRLNRASALRQLGRFVEAKKDYELYLKAKPDDPEGYIGAAKTAEGLDDEDEALSHYERVLQLNPKSVVGLIGKASILIRHKKYSEAIPLLDRAILGAPNDPEPHYRKGQALDRMGKHEEAMVEFAARTRLQKEQEAIEKIRKGLVRNPADTKLMVAATAWLLDHGYEEEGTTWASKVLAREPSNLPTIRLLADHFAKTGNMGRANYYKLMLPAEPRSR